MIKNINSTAQYRIISDSGGMKYIFYCSISGMKIYETKKIKSETPESALQIAWDQEAKKYFNYCTQCGRYVCDAMYNADTGKCVDCSVWEAKPRFCSSCGKKVVSNESKCKKCGTTLQYGR